MKALECRVEGDVLELVAEGVNAKVGLAVGAGV